MKWRKEYLQNNRPIFIVGAPRSGTTLLQYMLRSHPRISIPTGESHFIIPLYRNVSQFGDLRRIENVSRLLHEIYKRNPNFIDTDLHGMRFDVDSLAEELHARGCDTISKIIAGLFEKNASGEGKSRWGDKTPYYVLYLQTIVEMFPSVQVIHIIRDGRDCALSMFQRKYDFDVFSTYHAARYWKHFVDVGQKTGPVLGPKVYLEIRYEDLLSAPVAICKKISGFLGEEYTDSMVNFQKSRDKKSKTPLLAKSIQSANAEKWRRLMRPHQVTIFESVAGNTLKRNGYPLLTKAKPLSVPLRTVYQTYDCVVTCFYEKFLRPRQAKGTR